VPWTNISDGRVKKNMKQDVPGLDFIKRLQPVTYNLDLDAADRIMRAGKSGKTRSDSLRAAVSADDWKAREAQQKRVITGFVAQDVEKAAQSIGYDFSGVDVDDNGVYGLRYTEFIMPLVKAVQELSAQNDSLKQKIALMDAANNDATIASMQQQIEELTGLVNRLMEKENTPASGTGAMPVQGASLEQNFPNPFNHTTTIRYHLPQTFGYARIVISDTSGRVYKQTVLSGSGTGSVTVEARSLPAGIYSCSLYVDNTLVDTKKMVLTK
jgi:hypothetical protein